MVFLFLFIFTFNETRYGLELRYKVGILKFEILYKMQTGNYPLFKMHDVVAVQHNRNKDISY